MTEQGSRTGAARDVPPPRPVPPAGTPEPAEETPLGRAARTVAEAVAGLVGTDSGPSVADRSRAAGAGLRDVVGAVAAAVGGAFASRREGTEPPPSAEGPDAAGMPWSPGALLSDLLAGAAPRLPIRDGERLRQTYPGASDAVIADALVARAALLTSGIGAAAGGLTAVQWLAPASLLALPLQLGAETVLIAGVEVVLVGELHELYGRPAAGDGRTRAAAYLASWSAQRAVDGAGAAGLGSLLSSAGMLALRRQVTRKLGRMVPSAAPFLIGAAIAGRANRRATETLAERVLADLRAARPVARGS